MNKYYNHGDKFTPGTTVRSDAANAKFDGIETAFDQTEIDTNRSIKLPEGENVEITQTLSGRANTAIGFDENGNVALIPGAGRWTGNYQPSKLYTVRDIFRDAAGAVGLNNLYIVTKNFASTNMVADAANYDLLINVADVESAKLAAQTARNASANSATQSANSAAASLSSANASANSATQSANSASFATTEANRSTTQANRAKTEADRAQAAASSVDDTAFVTTATNQTVGGTKTFSNPITASLNGNANTATRLQTGRTINGVSFNGSSNITITANTPNSLTAGDGLSSSGTFNGGAARTIAVDGSVVRTSGNQSIGGSKTFTSLISGSISGNANSATQLQTARKINGVNFNGTADVTLPPPFPAGTRMLFQQSAAPTGWTKDTTHNNKALRVVSGTAGSGGSVAFSTAFSNKAVSGSIGNTTLSTHQMPHHNHVTNNLVGSDGSAAFNRSGTTGAKHWSVSNRASSGNGGNGSHTHSFSGTAINLSVQYVDLIIAVKS